MKTEGGDYGLIQPCNKMPNDHIVIFPLTGEVLHPLDLGWACDLHCNGKLAIYDINRDSKNPCTLEFGCLLLMKPWDDHTNKSKLVCQMRNTRPSTSSWQTASQQSDKFKWGHQPLAQHRNINKPSRDKQYYSTEPKLNSLPIES